MHLDSYNENLKKPGPPLEVPRPTDHHSESHKAAIPKNTGSGLYNTHAPLASLRRPLPALHSPSRRGALGRARAPPIRTTSHGFMATRQVGAGRVAFRGFATKQGDDRARNQGRVRCVAEPSQQAAGGANNTHQHQGGQLFPAAGTTIRHIGLPFGGRAENAASRISLWNYSLVLPPSRYNLWGGLCA